MAISPELPEHLKTIQEQKKLSFDILHDPNGAVAAAFGLNFALPEDLQQVYASFGLDLPTLNGDGQWQLPMPARYVIDAGGTIRYARVHPDYTTRPEPTETVEALQALANA